MWGAVTSPGGMNYVGRIGVDRDWPLDNTLGYLAGNGPPPVPRTPTSLGKEPQARQLEEATELETLSPFSIHTPLFKKGRLPYNHW